MAGVSSRFPGWRFGVALLGLLGLLPGCATPLGALWPFGGPHYPDPGGDLRGAAGRLLAQAIRFDTTNPPGNERPLAEFLAWVMRHEGLEARVISTPSEDPSARRAAVWARLAGSGRRRPVVLLSHLDVVPAEEDEWAVDPFRGVASGGYVVGRGALDAKGVTVVQVLALAELARRGVRLDRDVILLATPDEETGGQDGAGFLVREQRSLLHDAEFLLTEGGGILPGDGTAPDIWGVSFVEKTPCWIEVIARGPPGHGSAATPEAAVPRLVAALERVQGLEMPIRVVPAVEDMFAALAPYAAEEDRRPLADLAAALSAAPDFRARFLAEPGRSALVRDTIAVTVLRAGSRTNVVPAEASAQLDARLLPGDSCEAFMARLRDVIADPHVRVEPLLSFETRSSPVPTELYAAIEAAAAESGRPAVVVPRVIAGFTDAHYFRDLGIVAYGFVPRWLRPHDTRGIHGPNERVSIDNLERGVRTLVRILEILGGRDS